MSLAFDHGEEETYSNFPKLTESFFMEASFALKSENYY